MIVYNKTKERTINKGHLLRDKNMVDMLRSLKGTMSEYINK